MKIGVMTFWSGDGNYGQILQCWALQQYLRIKGHSPYVIRYIPTKYNSRVRRILKKILPVPFLRNVSTIIFRHSDYIANRRQQKKAKLRHFEGFRKDYLTFSDRVYTSIAQLRLNPPVADCYIVGSDQVWAQLLSNQNNQAFFLNFGFDKTKRIAYAPSFAMEDYPIELQSELHRMLEKFDALSVREYAGQEICSKIGFDEVEKVLDPTLLLSAVDYEGIMPKTIMPKPYVFIYSLNIDSSEEIRWNELRNAIDSSECEVKVTPASGYFDGKELFGNAVSYIYATPTEWLALIRDAQMVVTTSFHGVVFSIIFKTPFVYVPLEGKYAKGNSRILDLLHDLGLEKRILTSDVRYESIGIEPIDWNNVELKMSSLRKQSENYLSRNL